MDSPPTLHIRQVSPWQQQQQQHYNNYRSRSSSSSALPHIKLFFHQRQLLFLLPSNSPQRLRQPLYTGDLSAPRMPCTLSLCAISGQQLFLLLKAPQPLSPIYLRLRSSPTVHTYIYIQTYLPQARRIKVYYVQLIMITLVKFTISQGVCCILYWHIIGAPCVAAIEILEFRPHAATQHIQYY